MKTISLTLLLTLIVLVKLHASDSLILQLYNEPIQPTSANFVKLKYDLYSGHAPHNNLNRLVAVNDSIITIKLCKMTGIFDEAFWETDSVSIGQLLAGNYYVTFILNYINSANPSDSSCNGFSQPVDTAYLNFTVSALPSNSNFLKKEVTFTLTPNPATTILTITTDQPLPNTTLQLFSIEGKQLQQNNITHTTQTIDISTLPSGFYLAVLQNQNGKTVRKITINR